MEILVVDNDENFLKLMENFLIDKGHDVVTASDGLAALDMLRDRTPDMIFVDYVMPNIDGGALCRILKSEPKFAGATIVLLSAVAAEEWTDCRTAGADVCVAKTPFRRIEKDISEVLDDPERAKALCAAGNVFGVEEIFPRGITEELLTSKKHYGKLLNKMTEGIFELNSDHRIVYANPSSLKILNKAEHEILGASLFDLFPDEHRRVIESILENTDRAICGPREGQQTLIENKYLILKLATLEGKENHTLLFIDDITDLKEVEKSLQETNEILNGILDSARSFSVILTDLKQNVLFWNSGAENIFGYSAEEMVGKHKITVLYPGNRCPHDAEIVREKLIEKKEAISFETIEITKGGAEIWMKIHLSPRLDRNGNAIGILGIGEDITDWKIIEEEKEELQTQLLRSRKLESILTLAGGAAHDFNNLMMGMQGHISLAMLALKRGMPVEEHLKSLEEQIRKGAELTNKLLGLARGGKELFAPANLNRILKTVTDSFQSSNRDILVEMALEKDLWPVEIDRRHMEMVLNNILKNSAEAVNGKGKIVVETKNRTLEEKEVKPHGLRAGKYVEISIADNGSGIDKQTMDRIFDPFFTTKFRGVEKGSGLGLSSVYRTVKNHDGMIRVQSRPPEGTVFRICLPASEKNRK